MPVPMPARRPRRPGSIAKARANRHACVSRLCFMGNALMENRHGLLMENRHGLAVAATPNCATGTAGRAAALALVDDLQPASGATPGADNACDAWRFKAGLRERGVVPHMAGRSDRSWGGLPVVEPAGYQSSQRARKRVEETFASVKTIAGQSRTVFKTVFKTIFRGRRRVEASFTLAVIGGCFLQSDTTAQITGTGSINRAQVRPQSASKSEMAIKAVDNSTTDTHIWLPKTEKPQIKKQGQIKKLFQRLLEFIAQPRINGARPDGCLRTGNF